jgi:hypothetical protein
MCKVRVKRENVQKVSDVLKEKGFKFSVSEDTRKCYDCTVILVIDRPTCKYNKNNTCLLHENQVMFHIENLSGQQFHKIMLSLEI